MALRAGNILASMIIDDRLKNDAGQEATELMGGGYKRKIALENPSKIGYTLAGAAVRQIIKQGGRAVKRNISKQAVKIFALKKDCHSCNWFWCVVEAGLKN